MKQYFKNSELESMWKRFWPDWGTTPSFA